MRCGVTIWLLLAMVAVPRLLAAGLDVSPSALTLDQYVQTIDQYLTVVRDARSNPKAPGNLLSTLPPQWHIKTEDQDFLVTTSALRSNLADWEEKKDSSALDRATIYLETLREDAEAYRNPASTVSDPRGRLNDILARREFQNVHGQTWLDKFKQRINEFLIKLLGRAIASSSIPAISSVVVYGLIAIAVLAMAFWMYRSLRESTRLETIMPVAIPVSAKQWPVWMAEAQMAASRGQWRNAVHLAYWAGISFLEAQGSWRPDRARTPREYLRLLPASSPHQPSLLALTRRLEGVWYGMHDVGPEGFKETVAELERLGCPCN
ncbi:MAG: DUF4129 domain-containing protein [Candidatus Sulfotelmatobacter sp.]